MSQPSQPFTGPEDPRYIRWASTHTRPGHRTPSWKRANHLIALGEKTKGKVVKSEDEKKKTKNERLVRESAKLSTKPAAVKRRATVAAKKEAAKELSVSEPVITKTPNTITIVVENTAQPEEAVKVIEKEVNSRGPSTFVFQHLDSEGNLNRSDGHVFAYTRGNLKHIIYGVRNSRKSGERNGKTKFTFNVAKAAPTNFSLRDSINSNCVVEAIKKFYGSKFATKSGALMGIYDKYSLGSSGVTKEIMTEMAKKLKLRMIVRNAIDKVWFDTDATNHSHYKLLEFYALANHATCYVPISKFEDVSVVYGDCESLTADIHQLKRYYVQIGLEDRDRIQEITPEAIWTGDKIYKSFRPSMVSGDEKDDTNSSYYLCTNEEQFRYKQWVKANHLRPLEGVYFDIFRNADNYLTTQRFSNEEAYHLYDMNRAYPSFKTNPLYSKYKLVLGYCCLYDTSSASLSEVLDCAGVSLVSSIEWRNEFVQSTGWVRVDQWYNHIILSVLVSNGWATITVSQSCICRQPEDLEFPFGTGKYANNAFIGRLVTGASSVSRVEYTRVGLDDLSQVLFDYEVDPACRGRTMVYDGYESKYISATIDVADSRKQLHQIHGCIIAYQQVTMMQAMVLASSYTRVIAYNTDGFHTLEQFPMETSMEEGRFKYEHKPILYTSSPDPMPVKEFFMHWEASSLPKFRVELSVTLTTGPAGCGKSYEMIERRPGIESAVVCPLNELVVDTGRRTAATVSTYHKYFGIHAGGSYRKLKINEVVIADEVSMIPGRDLVTMINTCKRRRVCLDLIGDVREKDGVWDTDQMLPVDLGNDDGKITWDDAIRTCLFTHREVISPIRRQGLEDSLFCDRLRGMKLADMRACLVAKLGVSEWTDVISADCIGLSATHSHNHLYNNSIVRKYNPRQVPGRCIKTIKKAGEIVEAKGTIKMLNIGSVWCDRQSVLDVAPKNCRYELAYFRTSNAVQGQSLSKPYVINIGSCSARFLYTAVSRCRSLDLITLVDSGIDWSEESD